jgi:hypothetical protein
VLSFTLSSPQKKKKSFTLSCYYVKLDSIKDSKETIN